MIVLPLSGHRESGMNHPIYKITAFSIVAPFTISVRFDDEVVRTIDFVPVLRGELYRPLRDPRLFAQVRLDPEAHTLLWPNGADFDPATLHDWPVQAADVLAAVEHWAED